MTDQAIVPQEEKREVAPVTPMQLLDRAVQKGVDIEQLTKLMDLQERYEKNEARKAFEEDYAAFKSETVEIIRTAKGYNDVKYAPLDEVCEKIIPALSKHNLSHSWRMEQNPETSAITVYCTITHRMGHSRESFLSAKPDTSGNKNAIQAVASTVTYLERYTLMAACGVAARGQDDDGAGASQKEPITPEQKEQLIATIRDTQADTKQFLDYMKVQSLDALPADRFAEAQQVLEQRARAMAKKAKEAEDASKKAKADGDPNY